MRTDNKRGDSESTGRETGIGRIGGRRAGRQATSSQATGGQTDKRRVDRQQVYRRQEGGGGEISSRSTAGRQAAR
jgi:hypothetical protein